MLKIKINSYMEGFENAVTGIIDIVQKNIIQIPQKFIDDLENFYQTKRYEADQILDNESEY